MPSGKWKTGRNRSGAANTNWRGGRVVDPRGYVLLRMPGHHLADVRGYVYEHRLVAEQKLGRRLLPGEEVHHGNERKSDNDSENLKPVTKKRHRFYHRKPGSRLRLPDEPNVTIACACGCGSSLDRFDEHGRPRQFLSGHNPHPDPTKSAIRRALSEGARTRQAIVVATGISKQAVAVALSKMKRAGELDHVSHGVWALPKKGGA